MKEVSYLLSGISYCKKQDELFPWFVPTNNVAPYSSPGLLSHIFSARLCYLFLGHIASHWIDAVSCYSMVSLCACVFGHNHELCNNGRTDRHVVRLINPYQQ